MAFVTLVLGNLGLVLTNRSMSSSAVRAVLRPNPALGLVLGVTVVALALALEVPWLRGLFGFASLTFGQIGEAAAAGPTPAQPRRVLDGVKASTPAAGSLLDPACAPGGQERRSAPRNGPSVSPRNDPKEGPRAHAKIREGHEPPPVKFRDQKAPITHPFPCSGSTCPPALPWAASKADEDSWHANLWGFVPDSRAKLRFLTWRINPMPRCSIIIWRA
jgi:hypothetical protein